MRWQICLFAAQAAFAQLVVKVVEQGPESPVEDVRVELRLAGGLGAASRLTRRYPECQTNSSGECTFDDLIPGHYAIQVRRAGFVDAEDLQSRVIGISILLQSPKPILIETRVVRTGVLHGTVYSEDGKPIVLTPLKLLLMDPVEPRRRPPA